MNLFNRYAAYQLYVWGQFIDHDIDLSLSDPDAGEAFDIAVPEGDFYFDPFGTGDVVIPLTRSTYDNVTGASEDNPRQQLSDITAWGDGSMVYGSSQEAADSLRSFVGGRLLISEEGLLPTGADGNVMAGIFAPRRTSR